MSLRFSVKSLHGSAAETRHQRLGCCVRGFGAGLWAALACDVTHWSQWHLCATPGSGREGLVPTSLAGAASGAPCPQEGGSGPLCLALVAAGGLSVPPERVCLAAFIANPAQDQPPGRGCGEGCRARDVGRGVGWTEGLRWDLGMHEGVCVLSPVTSCLCQLKRRRALG